MASSSTSSVDSNGQYGLEECKTRTTDSASSALVITPKSDSTSKSGSPRVLSSVSLHVTTKRGQPQRGMEGSHACSVRIGDFRYEYVEGWGTLPAGVTFHECPGVAVDAQDNVYVLTRGQHPIMCSTARATTSALRPG